MKKIVKEKLEQKSFYYICKEDSWQVYKIFSAS